MEGMNQEPWIDESTGELAVITDVRELFEGDPGPGDLQRNRKDVWWSSDGAEWHEVPNTPWAPVRVGHAVCMHDPCCPCCML